MNTTKSEQIKAGLRKSFQTGESAKASTVCYGYKVDSLGKIAASLARMKVKSPTGKELWTRETISKILSNEKYVGDVILGKTQVQNGVQVKMVDHTSQTVINGHHEAIISRELFDIVQQEKAHRSRLKSHSHVV